MALGTMSPVPIQQFLDNSGRPLAGGKLYTYLAGTTTPLVVYADALLQIPLTNPVVLDSGGRGPELFLGADTYKFILKDALDATVWTADYIASNVVTTEVAHSTLSDRSLTSDHALLADNATHATAADSATNATNATHATSADSATTATTATAANNASAIGGQPASNVAYLNAANSFSAANAFPGGLTTWSLESSNHVRAAAGLYDYGRSTPIGVWLASGLGAGNFGSFTVSAQNENAFCRIGNTMYWTFYLTVSNFTGTLDLTMTIPGGATVPTTQSGALGLCSASAVGAVGGIWHAPAGQSWINMRRAEGGNWSGTSGIISGSIILRVA